MSNPDPTTPKQRYVFIDGLRGIAAVGVLLHHLYVIDVMQPTFERVFPALLVHILHFGVYGVQIFFVLSGFVIAHSLRTVPIDRASLGNFILRRQLRLDPPYWVMIAVVLCLQAIQLAVPSLVTPPMPHPATVLANLLYVQNVLRLENIVGVAWTLCIEIQFYLFFVGLLAAAKWLSKTPNVAQGSGAAAGLVFASGLGSLICVRFALLPVWFIQYWFFFASGVLCYWAFRKTIRPWVFGAFLLVYGACSIVAFLRPMEVTGVTDLPTTLFYLGARMSASGPGMMVGLLTVLSIYFVGIKGRLTTWGNGRLLQYFGRTSYSLYLVHLPLVSLVLHAGYKVSGENGALSVFWFLLAGLLSLGAAHLLYLAVELPSMRLASKLKGGLPRRADKPVVQATLPGDLSAPRERATPLTEPPTG